MQAIAREFNLSEATFVLQPQSLEATRRLRSFAPMAEVFGAGHNALGAWWAIIARGDAPVSEGETTLWQELGERVLPVHATCESGRLRRIAMTQARPRVGPDPPSLAALARALSLEVDALEVEGLRPQVISTGADHPLVPTRGLADLARVRVDGRELAALAKPLAVRDAISSASRHGSPRPLRMRGAFFPASVSTRIRRREAQPVHSGTTSCRGSTCRKAGGSHRARPRDRAAESNRGTGERRSSRSRRSMRRFRRRNAPPLTAQWRSHECDLPSCGE